jgi:AraC-like DNA-binding protein
MDERPPPEAMNECDGGSVEQLEYRKLIKVLEQVAGARERELYPVLAEALAVHLGWIDAFVAENPAYLALGSDGEEQYLTMFRPDFVEEYVERWRWNNPFASRDGVACLTRHGVATLGQLRLRATDLERDFADKFLRRNGIDDMLKIVVRSRATGAVHTLGVPFDGARRAVEPEDWLMAATLGPLLSPYFDTDLAPAYSAEFGEPSAPSTSAAIRRARRFCEEHAAEPITLGDIAAAAKVSVRTLQSGFREHLQTTPMAYLRKVRLARAHADLLHIAATGSRTTVTEVALRWGFTHLSRFAAFYRQTYGRAPSVTRRGRL